MQSPHNRAGRSPRVSPAPGSTTVDLVCDRAIARRRCRCDDLDLHLDPGRSGRQRERQKITCSPAVVAERAGECVVRRHRAVGAARSVRHSDCRQAFPASRCACESRCSASCAPATGATRSSSDSMRFADAAERGHGLSLFGSPRDALDPKSPFRLVCRSAWLRPTCRLSLALVILAQTDLEEEQGHGGDQPERDQGQGQQLADQPRHQDSTQHAGEHEDPGRSKRDETRPRSHVRHDSCTHAERRTARIVRRALRLRLFEPMVCLRPSSGVIDAIARQRHTNSDPDVPGPLIAAPARPRAARGHGRDAGEPGA